METRPTIILADVSSFEVEIGTSVIVRTKSQRSGRFQQVVLERMGADEVTVVISGSFTSPVRARVSLTSQTAWLTHLGRAPCSWDGVHLLRGLQQAEHMISKFGQTAYFAPTNGN
jgi:hypothetical protein